MSERIKSTTLPANYANGQILHGADVNKIINILREAVNYNKSDIDKLLFGYANDWTFPYKTNPVPEVQDPTLYLDDNTATEGQLAVVMNDGIDEDTIYLYRYVTDTWVHILTPSVIEAFLGYSEDSAEWNIEKAKLENGYYNGWHVGEDLTGQGGNIELATSLLSHLVKKYDMYLNTATSEVYICVSVVGSLSYWSYSFNMNAIEFRFTDAWDNDTTYYNNYQYVDLVYYGGKSYYCKVTHTSVGHDAPPDDTVNWGLYTSGSMDVYDDNVTTVITYTLVNNDDKTYTVAEPTSIAITIPASVKHGFYAGLNFKAGDSPSAVSFTNLSAYPLKIINFGVGIVTYVPQMNRTINMSFYCDGINIYCYINEVE